MYFGSSCASRRNPHISTRHIFYRGNVSSDGMENDVPIFHTCLKMFSLSLPYLTSQRAPTDLQERASPLLNVESCKQWYQKLLFDQSPFPLQLCLLWQNYVNLMVMLCILRLAYKISFQSDMASCERIFDKVGQMLLNMYPTSQWKMDPSKLPLTKYSSWNGCQANAIKVWKVNVSIWISNVAMWLNKRH